MCPCYRTAKAARKHKSSVPIRRFSIDVLGKNQMVHSSAFWRLVQTLKMGNFLHRVAGFLQSLSVSMVNSRHSGRYPGVNTGLLAATAAQISAWSKTAWIHRVQVLLHCCDISAFLVKEGSVHTCSANSKDPINFSKKPVTEEIQSVFSGQSRTSSMAAAGSLLYRRHWLYGGERVSVKALPATWWEIPAHPQHLHGSAET